MQPTLTKQYFYEMTMCPLQGNQAAHEEEHISEVSMLPHLQQVTHGRECVKKGVQQGINGAEALRWVPAEQLQDEVSQRLIHLRKNIDVKWGSGIQFGLDHITSISAIPG